LIDGASAIRRFAAAADRYGSVLLIGLSLVIGWMAVVNANAKPFWHDEIYTLQIAALPSVRDIWAAHREAVDLMPPLNSILTHAVGRVTSLGPVAGRLPALLCYFVFLFVIFEIARQRSNATVAVACVLLGYFSIAFGFAFNSRGYAAMLLFATVALYAWLEAARGRHRDVSLVLLAVSLAASVWSHYFAASVFVPIAAGEWARTWKTRRPDWGVWTAVLASLCLIAPLGALAHVVADHSAKYWHVATWKDVAVTYRELAGFLLGRRFLVLWAVVGLLWVSGSSRFAAHPERRLPNHEVVAGCTLLVLPILIVAAGVFATHAFAPRYALVGVLGFCLVLPLTVWSLGPADGRAESTLCLGLLALFVMATLDFVRHPPVQTGLTETNPLLERVLHDEIPVAVTGVGYLEAWYYTPVPLRTHLVYLTDREAALQFVGSDTLERDYQALRRWSPIAVIDYREFLATHPAFRVYSAGEFAWLPEKLRSDGATVTRIGTDGDASLYAVSLSGRSGGD
jgi:hypothetical protein